MCHYDCYDDACDHFLLSTKSPHSNVAKTAKIHSPFSLISSLSTLCKQIDFIIITMTFFSFSTVSINVRFSWSRADLYQVLVQVGTTTTGEERETEEEEEIKILKIPFTTT